MDFWINGPSQGKSTSDFPCGTRILYGAGSLKTVAREIAANFIQIQFLFATVYFAECIHYSPVLIYIVSRVK
jgi:hypothetical protein